MTDQRTVDDIASDFANAQSDAERAALMLEMDAVNESIAASHLDRGMVAEYQWAIGANRMALRGPGSVDYQRVRRRMTPSV